MKWPKLRELKEAVTSVVKGPYTHPFPKQPTPVPDGLRGVPRYDEQGCVGCGACAEICPARAIEVVDARRPDGTPVRRFRLHYDHCIFCGECARCCSTQTGIALSREYELSGLDRAAMVEEIEKELVPCELCGGAVGARDHLLWIHRQLGAQAYANVTVSLVAHEALGLRDRVERDDRPWDRGDIQQVLCPACRRGVTLLDEWGPVRG